MVNPDVQPSKSMKSSKTSSVFGWISIFLVFSIGFVGSLIGAGSLIRIVFPFIALVTGIYLYFSSPLLYVGYTWWIWCLTPLIRRLGDYFGSPDPSGFILLSPYLVTFVSIISLIVHLPKVKQLGGLPFVVALSAITYAFFIGVIQNAPLAAIRAFLDWVVPVLFGFHLFANWKDYPLYKNNIQKTFLAITLATGSYGIFQFITAPKWDVFWLELTQITVMGDPEPFGLRVWSTLHSTSPFATLMMASGILLLMSPSKFAIPISTIGYLSLLLTVVRSAWGGWLIGIVSLVFLLRLRSKIRLFITLALLISLLLPLVYNRFVYDRVSDRFESFTSLQNDQSFIARSSNYDRDLGIALTRFIGRGMGSTWIVNPTTGQLEVIVLDSGILDSFFTLGWIGSIFYIGSIVSLFWKSFLGKSNKSDSFSATACSISLAVLSQVGLSSLMIGFSGLIMWSFLGIRLASQEHFTFSQAIQIAPRKIQISTR